jgi:hypothetical protein
MANHKLSSVRADGGPAGTPSPGYQFGEHRCSTPRCRADRHTFKYEVRVGQTPLRLKANHVRCDRCHQLYVLTVTEDSQVTASPFVD